MDATLSLAEVTTIIQEIKQQLEQLTKNQETTFTQTGQAFEQAATEIHAIQSTAEGAASAAQHAESTAQHAEVTAQQAQATVGQASHPPNPSTVLPAPSSTVYKRKPRDIIPYSGRQQESFQAWKTMAEIATDGRCASELEQVQHCALFLRGNAMKWYAQTIQNHQHFQSWDSFCSALSKAFHDPDAAARLRQQLNNMSFNRNVVQFTDRFMEIATQIDDLAPAEGIFCYLSKLPTTVATIVRREGPTTLQEAAHSAQ
ncbi:hypothetical protein H4R33_006761, partial [Dimargaris cristalligena]